MNVIGIDVSKYDLGWKAANAVKPISFIIQRASYGIITDEQFAALLPEVQKIPIRGAYHYYSSNTNWKPQADRFLSVVKDNGFHFFALDYEQSYNTLDARTIAEVAEFVKYIKAQTGKPCLFYTNPDTFNVYIKPFGFTAWLNDQDFWVAQYPKSAGQTLLATYPVLPTGVNNWRIWQYGADAANTAGKSAGKDYGGITPSMDLNYYNGTIEQMRKWLDIAPPDPDPAPIVVTVKRVESIPGGIVPSLLSVTVDVGGVLIIQTLDQRMPPEPPPPPPVPVHNYYRVLDDIEAGRTVRNGLPSTVRFHPEIIATGKGGTGYVILSDALMRYAVKINDNGLGALKYQFADFDAALPTTFKDSVGWHNTGNAHRVEELTFSGNIVDVTRIVGNRAYIKCLYNGEPAPTEYILPPVQMFTIQYSNHLDIDGNGKQPRTFIVANPGEELWLDLKDLKKV